MSAKPTSNWSKLKTKVSKPRGKEIELPKVEEEKVQKLSPKVKANYVGLDCEMVGIGPDGTQSALARCCLVNFDGEVIYDEFVRPPGFVTDFRTKWSGVRKKDLRQGTAISLLECQTAVANILKDKVLVGHALRNDLDVLMLSHPRTMIRDTATYRPYMRIHGKHGKMRPRALRDLTKEHLGMEIQTGEHDPGVDARCAVMLYAKKRDEWEAHLKDTKHAAKLRAAAQASEDKEAARILAEEIKLKTAKRGTSSSSSTVGGEGEEAPATKRKAAKETTLHTQEKPKKKSSKGTTHKDGGLGKGISLDVEVQVLGGSDDDDDEDDVSEGSDNDDTYAEASERVGAMTTSSSSSSSGTALNGGKKRKISKNGMITSNSSKNHRTVDMHLAAVKRAKTEAEPVRGGSSQGSSSGGKAGMFGGVFGFAADGSFSTSGKMKSIAEVDRTMKSAQNKQSRAKR